MAKRSDNYLKMTKQGQKIENDEKRAKFWVSKIDIFRFLKLKWYLKTCLVNI